MAEMWFRGRESITALSESVGFKTGLAVDRRASEIADDRRQLVSR